MALGNEVVARNDPEDEPQTDSDNSRSADDVISELLGTSSSGDNVTQQVEAISIEPETSTEPEVVIVEETEEVVVVDSGDVEESEAADDAVADQEAEAEEEEEEEEEEEDVVPQDDEEEEEEEDIVDPVDEIREKCESKKECVELSEKLQACNDRVNSRSKTPEICHEEMMDYIHAVDHCIAKTLFSKLK